MIITNSLYNLIYKQLSNTFGIWFIDKNKKNNLINLLLYTFNFFLKFQNQNKENKKSIFVISGWVREPSKLTIDSKNILYYKSGINRKDVKIAFPNFKLKTGFLLYVIDDNFKGVIYDGKELSTSNILLKNYRIGNYIFTNGIDNGGYIDYISKYNQYDHLSKTKSFIGFNLLLPLLIQFSCMLYYYCSLSNLIRAKKFFFSLILDNLITLKQYLPLLSNRTEFSAREIELLDLHRINDSNDYISPSCTKLEYEVKTIKYKTKLLFNLVLDTKLEGGLKIYKDCYVANSKLIFSDTHLFENDLAYSPKLSFTAGRWNFIAKDYSSSSLNLTKFNQINNFPEATFLSSKDDTNWFHWVIETLPKLFFGSHMYKIDNLLILNKKLPKENIRLLDLLTSAKRFFISDYEKVFVNSLYTFNPINFHPDTLDFHFSQTCNLNINILQKFRDYILSKIDDSGNNFPEKIIFLRNSLRRMPINYQELLEVAKDSNYTFVDPQSLNFERQFLLSFNAKKIINFGGAAMANFLFSSHKTEIISLTSFQLREFLMPFSICKVSGADHSYLLGEPQLFNKKITMQNLHKNYYIDPYKFRKILN